MLLKILPFLIGGTLISGGVAAAVVISQKNSESKTIQADSSDVTGQQETDPSRGRVDNQRSQQEAHIQGSERGNSVGPASSEKNQATEITDSHSRSLGSGTDEKVAKPEPSVS